MTTAVLDGPQPVEPGVFDLDFQVQTELMRTQDTACSTDDGCGSTCEVSACHSQE